MEAIKEQEITKKGEDDEDKKKTNIYKYKEREGNTKKITHIREKGEKRKKKKTTKRKEKREDNKREERREKIIIYNKKRR